MSTPRTSSETLARRANVLRDRAGSLRADPASRTVVVGDAYRRRAAELELTAFVLDAHAGVRHDDLDRATQPVAA